MPIRALEFFSGIGLNVAVNQVRLLTSPGIMQVVYTGLWNGATWAALLSALTISTKLLVKFTP